MIRFGNHAFKELDTALTTLFAHLTAMSEASQALLAMVPGVLDRVDTSVFDAAKHIDKQINDAEIATDQLVADIINKFTIAGEDLRFILAAVKAAATLERGGDRIKNCIKRLGKISHPLDSAIHASLTQAVAALSMMLEHCLPQLIDYQPEAVARILASGGVVQRSYRAVLLRLHEIESGAQSADASHLLLIAKNLEQAADMAVEIVKIGHYVNFATKYDKNQSA